MGPDALVLVRAISRDVLRVGCVSVRFLLKIIANLSRVYFSGRSMWRRRRACLSDVRFVFLTLTYLGRFSSPTRTMDRSNALATVARRSRTPIDRPRPRPVQPLLQSTKNQNCRRTLKACGQ